MTPNKMMIKYQKMRCTASDVQYDYLIEKHFIRPNHSHYDILDKYSHRANNVVNASIYQCRQGVFNKKSIGWSQLDSYFKQARNKGQANIYSQMPTVHMAQQLFKIVGQNFDSWFKAVKAYKVAPDKFTGRPKLPSFKTKGGKSLIVIDNQTAKLRDGYVVIPCLNKLTIKLQHQNTDKIQQVRIIPRFNCFVVEIVYKTNKTVNYKPDNGRYLGIDPGLDNAFTIASNVKNIEPLVINGRPIKSINHFFNKRRAKLKSIADVNHQPMNTKQMFQLSYYRAMKLDRFAHESSKYIVKYALRHEINTIIIGNNKGLKRSSNMGKRNNQNFIGIPHQKLVEKLIYKANLAGIVVLTTNESYTSQTSFLDDEEPIKENGNDARKEKGLSPVKRRIYRGLFKSNTNKLINADVNGALQIIKKVVPNAFADGIEGIGLHPLKININF